jgi:hypothetical protein
MRRFCRCSRLSIPGVFCACVTTGMVNAPSNVSAIKSAFNVFFTMRSPYFGIVSQMERVRTHKPVHSLCPNLFPNNGRYFAPESFMLTDNHSIHYQRCTTCISHPVLRPTSRQVNRLIDTKELWTLNQDRQVWYTIVNLTFEHEFMAFRTTQPLLDLIRVLLLCCN